VDNHATHQAIEAVWREERARLVASLTRMLRDISLAEEMAQDALVIALGTWPQSGVPRNPGAWLMAAAKRKAIDYFRRSKMAERKLEIVGRDLAEDEQRVPDYETALDEEVGDDLLRLIFTSCHPVLSAEARVALTLRLIGGLTTDEIARAFLAAEPTIAQRIVRAKRTIADAGLPFEVPRGAERAERLASVLEVIYLIFNEGYSATSGEDWLRPQLCEEALRLGRVLAGLTPDEAEVHGLVALMELQASRSGARTDRAGRPVLLLDQDRSQWDHILIRRGLIELERAQGLAERMGNYTLQAAIAACHGRAKTAAETDWAEIAGLYEALAGLRFNPVVELNRAVALGFAYGPQVGLALADQLLEVPALQTYHLLPSVRGDLLAKLGRVEEARAEFRRAAGMTRNAQERALLLERAAGG
jgi:RNA polymerase sigma factor (sigma-70 family)